LWKTSSRGRELGILDGFLDGHGLQGKSLAIGDDVRSTTALLPERVTAMAARALAPELPV